MSALKPKCYGRPEKMAKIEIASDDGIAVARSEPRR